MSMYYAGYEVFGLVLNEDDIEIFKENYIKKHPEDYDVYDCEDDIDEAFYEQLTIERTFVGCNGKIFYTVDVDCTSISGMCSGASFYPLFTNDENLKKDYKYINLDGFRMTVVETFFQCDPIQVFNGKFYKNSDEVINEMKDKLCDYLPEDFPYAKRIGIITYAAYA